MHGLFNPNFGLADVSLSQNRLIDREFIVLGPTPNDGVVGFVKFVALHRFGKPMGRFGGFGDEDDAAGFAVEPSDDRNLPAVGDFEKEKILQLIEKRSWPARSGRVD